jgi:hypothetical protein
MVRTNLSQLGYREPTPGGAGRSRRRSRRGVLRRVVGQVATLAHRPQVLVAAVFWHVVQVRRRQYHPSWLTILASELA